MRNHVKVQGDAFKAYIPAGALITVEYKEAKAHELCIEDIASSDYCLVNGIRFYGSATKISLNAIKQWGTIKQECEIVETIKGSMKPGQRIQVNHTTTVSEGKFVFKPIRNETEQEEYHMKVIPDYSELLNEFLQSNPGIDKRIKDFLSAHPELLDTHNVSMMNTSQVRWVDVSQILKLIKDGEDETFVKTSIEVAVGAIVADEFMKYF